MIEWAIIFDNEDSNNFAIKKVFISLLLIIKHIQYLEKNRITFFNKLHQRYFRKLGILIIFLLDCANASQVGGEVGYKEKKRCRLRPSSRADQECYLINPSSYMTNRNHSLMRLSHKAEKEHFTRRKSLFDKA